MGYSVNFKLHVKRRKAQKSIDPYGRARDQCHIYMEETPK